MSLNTRHKLMFLASIFICMIIIPFLSGIRREAGNISEYMLKESGENFNNLCRDFFCVLDEATGQVIKINDKEFMYGALVTEMPPSFHEEALKAQAVATYTYFSRNREQLRKKDNDPNKPQFTVNTDKWHYYVTKEKMKNKWGDSFDKHYLKIKGVVDKVFGEVIEENGNLILAAYHAISSGKTERSEDVFGGKLEYLTSVSSPGDKLVPGYETHVEKSSQEFRDIICSNWDDCNASSDPSSWIGEITRTESGMVKDITVCSHKTTGKEIRSIFSLRSADFDLQYNDGKFLFTVRGYGHGVGMSQYGAEYMANQGADYKQILSWYYPDTGVRSVK